MNRAPLALAAVVLAVAACSSASSVSSSAPRPDPAPSKPVGALSCAWYTPTMINNAADGQQVIVTATGPACGSQALIRWVSLHSSGMPWASTRTITGTIIAQVAKAGTVVRIYQDGWASETAKTAGYLADDFQAAGWAIEVPAAQASVLLRPGR